jgi:hypothetical protein
VDPAAAPVLVLAPPSKVNPIVADPLVNETGADRVDGNCAVQLLAVLCHPLLPVAANVLSIGVQAPVLS